MLVPMQNRLVTSIRNMAVSRKHLDFVHLQMVTYPNQVEHSNIDERNYEIFGVPMNYNGDCRISRNVVGSLPNDTYHGLDGDTSEAMAKKPSVQCDYCGKENGKLQ